MQNVNLRALVNWLWSGRLDLNQRPPRPERGALPTALRPDIQHLNQFYELKRSSNQGSNRFK